MVFQGCRSLWSCWSLELLVSGAVCLWSWSLELCFFAMCVLLAFLMVLLDFVFGEELYCGVVFLGWVVVPWGVIVLWCCWVLGWLFKLVLGG